MSEDLVKTKVIVLRLAPSLMKRLRAQAKREQRTVSSLIRLILSQGVVLRQATIDTR